jgi:hypothetical protein
VVTHVLDQALVRTILEHPAGYPWRMQNIGLLALRLDDRREFRLHVWDPESCVGEPPVHDHPYDFTSTVIVGELVNTRYVEDPNGIEYSRHRYHAGDEDDRRTDSVRLTASETTFTSGDRYRQLATELHRSRQTPGTVTLLQFGPFEERELTVCLAPGAPWVSALARPATAAEVKRITAAALDRFPDAASMPGVQSSAV